MKRLYIFFCMFALISPLDGPQLEVSDSYLRSTHSVADNFKKIISLFSFSEQYRPILELVNTVSFSQADDYEVSHFLEEMLPDASLLGALEKSSWWYLFSAEKLPVWLDVTLSFIILALTTTNMLPALIKPNGEWIEFDQVHEAALGFIGFLGVPVLLFSHAAYRLIKKDTLAQVSNYFMASHMAHFFISMPPTMVPRGLKNWFSFYADLNEEDLEKRIKRGLLLNDLGVALCAISITNLQKQ